MSDIRPLPPAFIAANTTEPRAPVYVSQPLSQGQVQPKVLPGGFVYTVPAPQMGYVYTTVPAPGAPHLTYPVNPATFASTAVPPPPTAKPCAPKNEPEKPKPAEPVKQCHCHCWGTKSAPAEKKAETKRTETPLTVCFPTNPQRNGYLPASVHSVKYVFPPQMAPVDFNVRFESVKPDWADKPAKPASPPQKEPQKPVQQEQHVRPIVQHHHHHQEQHYHTAEQHYHYPNRYYHRDMPCRRPKERCILKNLCPPRDRCSRRNRC